MIQEDPNTGTYGHGGSLRTKLTLRMLSIAKEGRKRNY